MLLFVNHTDDAVTTDQWDLSRCPSNAGGSRCWADSAYQECTNGRQKAYDWVAGGNTEKGMWERYRSSKCGPPKTGI